MKPTILTWDVLTIGSASGEAKASLPNTQNQDNPHPTLPQTTRNKEPALKI